MKISIPVFTAFALLFCMACASKHQHQEASTQDSTWKAMDDFHFVMAESFHPYKDSANLEPAKKYAAEMDSIAGIWLASSRPEKVNTEEVKAKLEKLKADTKRFATAVNVEVDSILGKSLTDLHDQFHGLQEAWYGGHEKHEDHH